MKNKGFYIGTLILCLMAVFGLHHEFLFMGWQMDDLQFLRTPLQRYLLSGVPTRPSDWLEVWNFNHGWFYRPVYLTYWMVMHTLHLANPVLMHAVGLVAHALIVWLWGLLVYRLSGRAAIAIASSTTFLLWPGKAQAISWISSHSTLFAVIGVLVAAHCWLHFRRGYGQKWKWFSLIAFWLGCCAKNDAAVGIVLLPMLDWFNGVRLRDQWRDYVPHALACLVYLGCEFRGARLYGMYGDPVYNTMAHVSFIERFRYVLSWLSSFTNKVPPFYPWSALSLLTIPFAMAVSSIVRGSEHTRLLIFATLLFFIIAIPVPFMSAFHSMGSRFQYFPALPASLLFVLLMSECAKSAQGLNARIRETTDSAFGLSLCTLLVAVVYRPSWITNDPIFNSMVALGLVGVGAVAIRAGWLDWRVLVSLALALLSHELVIYIPTEDGSFWPIVAVITSGLVWQRQWAVGMLLCYAMSLNPMVLIAALIGRAVYSTLIKTADKAGERKLIAKLQN